MPMVLGYRRWVVAVSMDHSRRAMSHFFPPAVCLHHCHCVSSQRLGPSCTSGGKGTIIAAQECPATRLRFLFWSFFFLRPALSFRASLSLQPTTSDFDRDIASIEPVGLPILGPRQATPTSVPKRHGMAMYSDLYLFANVPGRPHVSSPLSSLSPSSP